MGNGATYTAEDQSREISTMHLILVLLADSRPHAMSTYEIGLAVTDDKEPPRPISVLIKSLSKDKYVRQTRRVGKRAALWTITDRGMESLHRRSETTQAAREWISKNPNHSAEERAVLRSLHQHGPQAASRLAETCEMLHSPVRTALKRLTMRGFIKHSRKPISSYKLTRPAKAHMKSESCE